MKFLKIKLIKRTEKPKSTEPAQIYPRAEEKILELRARFPISRLC